MFVMTLHFGLTSHIRATQPPDSDPQPLSKQAYANNRALHLVLDCIVHIMICWSSKHVRRISGLYFVFWENKSSLERSPDYLRVCLSVFVYISRPHNQSWLLEPFFMKDGMRRGYRDKKAITERWLSFSSSTLWRRMGEWMYRSTFPWPRDWLEVSGQLHAPAALPPRKAAQYTLDRRLSGLQTPSGRYGEVKILDPTGTRTPTPRSFSP
jgi:hypothetical protein